MSFESPPRRPPPSASGSVSRSWAEWTQQLQAYMAWVNSQLRKKPGTKEVKDLRRELQDGTVLVELIEIVADEKIPGAHANPANSLEMKENVERVLQFMRSRKIKMHQIRSSDIVEGNMKSIMRLILALAAHFKPSSVKQSSSQQAKTSRSLGIAQEAASTLASIKRDADSIKRKMHRPMNLDAGGPLAANVEVHTGASKPPINRKLGYDSPSPHTLSAQRNSPSELYSSPRSGVHDSSSDGDVVDRVNTLLEDVDDSHSVLLDETKSARTLLVDLQNVLLNGQEDLDVSYEVTENIPTHEQLVIYQARLQQAENTNTRFREDLSRLKQECMQLQGMKQGLHNRLSEQQQEILQMKADALSKEGREHDDDEEVEQMREELTEKTTMLNRLHTELERRDKTIEHLQSELKAKSNHSEQIIRSLETQLQETRIDETFMTNQPKSTSVDFEALQSVDLKAIGDSTMLTEIQTIQATLQQLATTDNECQLRQIDKAVTSILNTIKDDPKTPKPTAEVKGHRVLHRKPTKPDTTKLLCFSAKSVTPSMRSVTKKLGEITLQDFKDIFCPGPITNEVTRLKFTFKTQEPDVGVVKEEIAQDDEALPSWEGKIIGWIEEELYL